MAESVDDQAGVNGMGKAVFLARQREEQASVPAVQPIRWILSLTLFYRAGNSSQRDYL